MRGLLQKPVLLVSLIVMIPLWYGIGYQLERAAFPVLISLFSALFGCYILVCWNVRDTHSYWWALGFAIGLRLMLLPAVPFLSDDVYRFIWDGRLLAQGMDPFAHTPRWLMQHTEVRESLVGLTPALFEKLNSPDYYTVYPPFCQGVFGLAGWLFPKSILGSIVLLRSLMINAELVSFYLLHKLVSYFHLPMHTVLLYALNPLVLAELTGNLHLEGFMIAFLLGAFWLLLKQQWALSGLFFSGAVLAKLLPLVFLPGLLRRIGWLRAAGYGFLSLVLLLGGFLAVSSVDQLSHMLASVDLYFRTFEFNASFYYLLRWVGFQWQGYNMISTIGPSLGVLTAIVVLTYALCERVPAISNWPSFIVTSLAIYLALTTTVHPWYVTPLVAFGALTRFWFPFVWAFVVLFSYATYQVEPYQEVYWLTALEYLSVAATLVFDYWRWRFKTPDRKSDKRP